MDFGLPFDMKLSMMLRKADIVQEEKDNVLGYIKETAQEHGVGPCDVSTFKAIGLHDEIRYVVQLKIKRGEINSEVIENMNKLVGRHCKICTSRLCNA